MRPTTYTLALMAVFTALFALMHAVPISVFIGGAGLITVAVIMTPIISKIFKPLHVLVMGLGAGLIVFGLGLAVAPVFGIFSFFLFIVPLFIGSLAWRDFWGKLAMIGWIIATAIYYMAFGGTWLWLVPYAIALGLLFMSFFTKHELYTLITMSLGITIVEVSMMNVLSISVLLLPPFLWTIIFPFMYYERTVAVIGSVLILKALKEKAGELIEHYEH